MCKKCTKRLLICGTFLWDDAGIKMRFKEGITYDVTELTGRLEWGENCQSAVIQCKFSHS